MIQFMCTFTCVNKQRKWPSRCILLEVKMAARSCGRGGNGTGAEGNKKLSFWSAANILYFF